LATDPEKLDSIEKRINELHLLIKDSGGQADLYKAKTAGALGGGVFTLMLALGAAYDLATGNSSVQIGLGVSKNMFIAITIALAVSSLALFALAAMRERRRNSEQTANLEELEEELAQLLDKKKSLTESAQ
jgi:hypothetical protein